MAYKMDELRDKVALVTGAGQGVGQGIALALAAKGVRVAITGRTEGKLLETVRLIKEEGGEAISVVGNVKSSWEILGRMRRFRANISLK